MKLRYRENLPEVSGLITVRSGINLWPPGILAHIGHSLITALYRVSADGTTIHPVTQAQNLRVTFDSSLSLHPISSSSANSVVSPFQTHPETNQFTLPPLPPPQTKSPPSPHSPSAPTLAPHSQFSMELPKWYFQNITVHVSYFLKILQGLSSKHKWSKALLHGVSPPSLSRIVSCHSSFRFPAPDIPADLPFLIHAEEGPTTRSVPLRSSSFRYSQVLSSFKSLLKCHIFREGFPDHPV